MNVLVVSKKCTTNCIPLMKYIESKQEFSKIIRIHDIHEQGVPGGIKRVPTLIKNDGTILIGGDIKSYLDSLIDSIQTVEPSCTNFGFDINGDVDDGAYCSINSFGSTMAPQMTKELEEKINSRLEDAMKKFQ